MKSVSRFMYRFFMFFCISALIVTQKPLEAHIVVWLCLTSAHLITEKIEIGLLAGWVGFGFATSYWQLAYTFVQFMYLFVTMMHADKKNQYILLDVPV